MTNKPEKYDSTYVWIVIFLLAVGVMDFAKKATERLDAIESRLQQIEAAATSQKQ